MNQDNRSELYQQVIIEHNKNPRNFKEIKPATHSAEGYNPLCGDHLHIYLNVNDQNVIDEVAFIGDGCAISKASASMMTQSLKDKTLDEAKVIFEQFHDLIIGNLDPDKDEHVLGKLKIFSGIWHYPSRVKCASLCWHAMTAALSKKESVTTE